MKFCVAVSIVLCSGWFAGTAWGQSKQGEDGLAQVLAELPSNAPSEAPGAPLTLDQVERIALANNPEIAVATRRLAMSEAHVPTVGALDDPTVMYRGWGVPLKRPWDYNDAQNMISISQTFPGG